MTPFSQMLAALPAHGEARVVIGDDWLQGRTVFGGLQAALAVETLRREVADDTPLRVLQVSFIAPVPAGELRIEPRILRRGRSAIHGEARLVDAAGQTLCLVLGIFGTARPSTFARHPAMPLTPAREQSQRLPYLEGVTPSFTRHFRSYWAEGKYPFSGAEDARTRIWIGHKDPGATPGIGHLIALADVIPSPALSTLRQPTMASSLTWTLDLLNPRTDFDPEALWLIDAEATAGGEGYVSQTATLFNPAGEAAAYARQTVVVFG